MQTRIYPYHKLFIQIINSGLSSFKPAIQKFEDVFHASIGITLTSQIDQ